MYVCVPIIHTYVSQHNILEQLKLFFPSKREGGGGGGWTEKCVDGKQKIGKVVETKRERMKKESGRKKDNKRRGRERGEKGEKEGEMKGTKRGGGGGEDRGFGRSGHYLPLVFGAPCREGHDRNVLTLPGQQLELMQQVRAAIGSQPLVLVLMSGGPVDISWAKVCTCMGQISNTVSMFLLFHSNTSSSCTGIFRSTSTSKCICSLKINFGC